MSSRRSWATRPWLVVFAVVQLSVGGLLLAAPATTRAASLLFPDLQTLPPRDLRLERADVSVDASGVFHNVLKFSNTVINVGPGRLEMRGVVDPVTHDAPAIQRVYDDAGGFVDYSVGTFIWHPVHQHYHFENWGNYALWTKADYDHWIATGRSQGQAKKVGTKTTSCVMDEEFVTTLPNTPWPARYPSSGCLPNSQNLMVQGLSPGWGDTYDYYRFEQWIDLDQETLADGDYVLRSVTDPTNKIYESASKADGTVESQIDNEATTLLSVVNGKIVDTSAPSGTVSVNHVAPSTPDTNVSVQVLGRDDVSAITKFRLSNDGTTWTTPMTYAAPGPSTAQDVPWDLADPQYGGTSSLGTKTVYAQFQDGSGRWSATVSDTIDLVAPSSAYEAAVLADSPASYWRLGETSGTTAADRRGVSPGTYRNGVTLGRASLIAGDPNPAAGFDGVDDDVRIASTSALNPTAAVSVEVSIKPAALPAAGSFASIVTKAEAYSLQFNGPRLEFTIMQGGVRRRLQAPVGAVVAGSTYHVVGTYDGTTQRLYLNGTQVASVALTGAITANGNDVTIGSWNGTKERILGTVDDVAVYRTALSAARVSAHGQAAGG